MTRSANKIIPDDFPTVPCLDHVEGAELKAGDSGANAEVLALGVSMEGGLPPSIPYGREQLERVGFRAERGQTYVVPGDGAQDVVAVGMGSEALSVADYRDLAAAAVRAVSQSARVALVFALPTGDTRTQVITALVEGALLARYRYTPLKGDPKQVPLAEVLVVGANAADQPAIDAGRVNARAAVVARDLANTPPGHLTATDMAQIAAELGERFGFEVESFDKQQLIEMGCGGLLGVNQGSVEEPRMVVLRYRPQEQPTGSLGFIGKGIMYDSGGISLKPSDPMHLLMKMDMGGAAAVLGAFTGMRDSGTQAQVTGWLMCTDNMPSGTAYKLGDVLTARGGTTIEVKNTDAEGRLAMSDAFVLANEEGVDAIVDIATLTGAALVSLGGHVAALLGNDDAVIEAVKDSSAATDEQVWQLPLVRKYRSQLDSDIADIANLGGPFAGTITAALFLDHFTAGTPWAHLDIAGTMQVDKDDSWRSKGATGFGARILLDLAGRFAKN
ncbi:leucyl aminopeptidase [Timonella senegalensis]|uniref:leucyl aminopeptidase n=1 Tax=Timonella senegalensis TaxID=1465825 RepID=UPI0028ABBA81|nr:leucyl aminopeptidase [Timonella senegalensis]